MNVGSPCLRRLVPAMVPTFLFDAALIALPAVLLDVATLVSGGLKGVVPR